MPRYYLRYYLSYTIRHNPNSAEFREEMEGLEWPATFKDKLIVEGNKLAAIAMIVDSDFALDCL